MFFFSRKEMQGVGHELRIEFPKHMIDVATLFAEIPKSTRFVDRLFPKASEPCATCQVLEVESLPLARQLSHVTAALNCIAFLLLAVTLGRGKKNVRGC